MAPIGPEQQMENERTCGTSLSSTLGSLLDGAKYQCAFLKSSQSKAVAAWYPLVMLRSTGSKGVFYPSRQKGQNFLKDQAVIAKIVSAIHVGSEDTLVEIGAGSGELTLPLTKTNPARILALEPEKALAQRLREALRPEDQVSWDVIEKDFLSVEISELLNEYKPSRARIVGNLPYSVASPILLKLLDERKSFIDMTLMFQLEVAERLVAKPGTKAYGFLSVMTQQATRPRMLFQIPPNAFRPRPKVHSAMVRLEPLGKDELFVREPKVFETIVKSLFAHRRKNISNNIKHLRSTLVDPTTLRSALDHVGIEPSRRAETLTVNEFVALARFCTSRQ